MSLGLSVSLLGAFFQALNYVATQRCQQASAYRSTQILIATQVSMAFIVLVPFLAMRGWQYLAPEDLISLVKINAPYAVAQFFVILAIRKSDASIVSPMLTLKIPTLTVMAVVMGQGLPSSHQLLATALILLLAYALSRRSGSLDLWPALFVIVASVGYALSDTAMTHFSTRFLDLSLFHRVALLISVNYIFCGIVSAPGLCMTKAPLRIVYDARWIGLTWVIAVYLLVVGFITTGVLKANVAQSMRGVFGILIAMVLARSLRASSKDWSFKIAISVAMTAAVFLYFL
ncbi:hypothetical protein [uncultured Cohaesibacter sp.]|uniref:hypothetical protein n=1 Tax=uncultured Cohaesibacter sp. TaxID=1002546 RepID=UPI0029C873C9|nr:hypothetical protein [uncultured Cohaesibacter sp.]